MDRKANSPGRQKPSIHSAKYLATKGENSSSPEGEEARGVGQSELEEGDMLEAAAASTAPGLPGPASIPGKT